MTATSDMDSDVYATIQMLMTRAYAPCLSLH